jgi:UDP-N-acetylglucosamine:LPS N-acetylglucosamine transferase
MKNKILAVASNGGHLVQLLRLFPALQSNEIHLVSTSEDGPDEIFDHYYCVSDSNFEQKFKLIKTAFETLFIYLKVRPDVVISTGAAPGFFCILYAVIFRKKAIWFDSIANTEKLSMAGNIALKLTKHCYTQWPKLVGDKGPYYIGAVI